MYNLAQQAILGVPAHSTVSAKNLRGAVRNSAMRGDANRYLATLVETDRLSRPVSQAERSLKVSV